LDFTDQVPEQFESEIHLTITKSGRLDGFLLWLTIDTAPGVHLDTLAERTHWLPVYFPVFSPGIEVRVGDSISGVCRGSLPSRAITPDYQIDGYLQFQGGRKEFQFVSSCGATDFRSNEFYQNLFADGYQNRYVLPSGSIDPGALEQHLKLKLPEYMVPSTFVGVSELPRTTSGKLDRQRLPAPAPTRAREEFLAPRTALQGGIADIWSDLLKMDMVGLDENFFDLGGHSLLAVQMVSRLRKQFNLAVPVVTVFQHPTIRLLADAMRSGGELD
jgi:acyl carrier protein